MGIPAPNGGDASQGQPGDQANFVAQGSFVAAGQSIRCPFYGAFNFAIWGLTPSTAWGGSVQLERSFDGGMTWLICGVGGAGQGAIYTGVAQAGVPVSVVASEPERGVLYRLNCTAYVSGTINYRLSVSGLAAMAWGVPSA